MSDDVRHLCDIVDELNTQVIVAWSYVSAERRHTERASELYGRSKEITKRLREGLPPPPPPTDEQMRRAHETIVAAFDQRENRLRVEQLSEAIRSAITVLEAAHQQIRLDSGGPGCRTCYWPCEVQSAVRDLRGALEDGSS